VLLLGFGLFVVVMVVKSFYRKVEQGKAMIINPMSGPLKVTTTGAVVYPVINKAEIMDVSVKAMEIDRRGKEGLICQDNIRADIKVSFFVRVNQTDADVLKVAQSIGCERASTRETLEELFNAKFSEALKTVGKKMDFVDLYQERDGFREEIIEVIGRDLNGYSLEDVAIDYLEQTPKESLDPDNILDAQGIRKITELTSKEAVVTNEYEKNKERDITEKNVTTKQQILELQRAEEEAEAVQNRQVEIIRATEAAATEEVKAQQLYKSESARIKMEEDLAVAEENKQRQIEVARKNKERTIAVEVERVERDRALEEVERLRLVTLKDIAKEKEVEVEKKEIQDVIRERVAVERTVAEEEEKIKDTHELAAANRKREVEVIEAEREAQENLVTVTKAAEAKELAAKKILEEQKSLAEAELIKVQKATDANVYQTEKNAEAELVKSEKLAQAKKTLAEGIIAENAAAGLAKVKVEEAEANAIELKGRAEATAKTENYKADAYGVDAKGVAEAKALAAKGEAEATVTSAVGIAEAEATQKAGEAEATAMAAKFHAEAQGIDEKAAAMKKFDEVGREHEEFKLELAKAERIELAQIEVNRDIAEAQAKVLGEAMKSANIDIVGGGDEFLERFLKAVSMGKTIDGFVNHSQIAQDVTEALTYGEDDGNLVDRVRSLIDRLGVTSEDVKNLSVAAALNKLADRATSAEDKKEVSVLRKAAEDLGITEMAALFLANK
jgi:uncharacterized membrane protein YqiK